MKIRTNRPKNVVSKNFTLIIRGSESNQAEDTGTCCLKRVFIPYLRSNDRVVQLILEAAHVSRPITFHHRSFADISEKI